MTRQEQIIKEVAKRHGLSFSQGLDIFENCGRFIATELSSQFKDKTVIHQSKDLLSVNLMNFGKFIPNSKAVAVINKKKLEKLNKNEES